MGAMGQGTNSTAKKREGFSSSFGVLAATLGSAVGLGNIWKFPSLTGTNGGAGFLLVYLLSTLLIGLPVMIAEITLGRKAKANPITALQTLAPSALPWWRSEEHTSELQSRENLVCRLLLEKKKKKKKHKDA